MPALKTAHTLSPAIFLAALACSRHGATDAPPDSTWIAYHEGHLSLQLPAWPTSTSTDSQVIHSVSDGVGTFWIKPWPLIPRLVAENVRTWTEQDPQATLLSEAVTAERARLEMTIVDGNNVLRLRTLLLYCDAQTYEITGATAEGSVPEYSGIIDDAQNSAVCAAPERPAPLATGALGMVIVPRFREDNTFSLGDYQESLALAADHGVQVSHYYTQWGDIERQPGVYDWTTLDYILEANALEGLRVSLVVNVIHTTVRGRVPPDLTSVAFDDSRFADRLAAFLTALADRYADRVHYLSIGNEVNDYFVNHRDQIPAYAAAFDQARAAIHSHQPDLPVGVVFAYHDAERLNALDIIPKLDRGDFIAYTLYLSGESFHFTRSPSLIGEYLDGMLAAAAGTPMAITETGWNTAAALSSSEAAQAVYVDEFFQALSQRRDRILFANWFDLHDSRPDNCYDQALTFFEPGTEPDPATMQAFVTFLCYFGLRQADGSPKAGWTTWVQDAEAYYH